jgi:hypothetical protein
MTMLRANAATAASLQKSATHEWVNTDGKGKANNPLFLCRNGLPKPTSRRDGYSSDLQLVSPREPHCPSTVV